VSEVHLDREGLFQTGHPWLISAGWPCQDYSSAGLGTLGRRAAVLHDVARIIHMMQQRHRDLPPGYILENVAMQHNFRHEHIKFPVYDQIVEQLGTPVTFDAAQAGSYAHRLRNYWTNLVHPEHLQQLLDSLDIPRDKVIDEILGHGRTSRPVEPNEQTISGRRYNTVGSPRAVMPTLDVVPTLPRLPGRTAGVHLGRQHQET
jgi:site-specific DNA-cytosine methylase